MLISGFSFQYKMSKIRFFEKIFLTTDTCMEVGLGIYFLTLSNADIPFDTESFTWRSYSTAEALPTARWVELIGKHKFAKTALDENSETFVMHVVALDALKPVVYNSLTPLLAVL